MALLASQSDGLVDILVNCGARFSWSAGGRGRTSATRQGVLAVGLCVLQVCVLTADCL